MKGGTAQALLAEGAGGAVGVPQSTDRLMAPALYTIEFAPSEPSGFGEGPLLLGAQLDFQSHRAWAI